MRILIMICLVLIFFSYLCISIADITEKTQPNIAKGEELFFEKIPSVFAAAKREQSVMDAPSFVSIITSEDIERYGYNTLGEALSNLAGMYINYDRNYEYIGIRGFCLLGDLNTRILVLIDGHAITDIMYNQSFVGNDSSVDIKSIDKIEIIRGPGSALYGTNAILAVINVITKKPSNQYNLEATGMYGDYKKAKGYINYGKYIGKSGSILFSGALMNTKGGRLYFEEFKDTPSGGYTSDTDYERYLDLLCKSSWKDISLSVCMNGREKGVPTAPWDGIFDDKRTKTIDSSGFIKVKYEKSLLHGSKIIVETYLDRVRYFGSWPYQDENVSSISKESLNSMREGLEGQFTNNLKNNNITLGTEIHNCKAHLKQYDEYAASELSGYLPLLKRSLIFGALYVQDQIQVLDKLGITIGAHYDRYESFGGITNPMLAIVYKPYDDTAIKLLYGKAFKGPTLYELYYTDGYATIGNEDLKPEKIQSYELGFEKSYGIHFWNRLSVYYYDIDDLVNQVVNEEDMVQYRNTDGIKAKGIEFDLKADQIMNINLYLNGNIQSSEYKDTGEEPSNSPRFIVNFGMNIPLWRDNLSLALNSRYVSKRISYDPEISIDSYKVFNLSLSANKILENIDFAVRIYNILNEKYYHLGAGEHKMLGIQQDGRKFLMEATFRF